MLVDTFPSPVLIWEMMSGLKHWIDQCNNVPNDFTPGSLAGRQQQHIGWKNMLRGWLSSEWTSQQLSYKMTAWNIKVATFLVKFSQESWVDRCEMTHNCSAPHKTEFQRT